VEEQRLLIAKSILNKKSNADAITIWDFELYYRAIITRTASDCE
jgi:hypothetical protein